MVALEWNLRNLAVSILILVWWSEFLVFHSEKSKKGQKTYNLIFISILISIGFSFVLFISNISNMVSREFLPMLELIGIFIIFLGLSLRYWSAILLGNNFTRDLIVPNVVNLVSVGPYRYLRHPLYLGLFLIVLGVSLFIGNLIGVIFTCFLMFIALKKRINEEERLLEERLGDKYIEWKKNRYKYFPFIY